MIKIEYNNGTVIGSIQQAVILGGCVCEKLEAGSKKQEENIENTPTGENKENSFGASAEPEKNISTSEAAASIASVNLNVCDSPRMQASGCSHLPSDSILTDPTSNAEIQNCSPQVAQNCPSPHDCDIKYESGEEGERREWRMLPILLYQGHTMAEVRRTNEIIGIMCHRSAPELVAKLVQLDNEERILLDGLGAKELHDILMATYPGMTVTYGALREAMRLAG